MGSVVIRNLDDEVITRLKAKAGSHGRSLEAELREIVSQASRPDPGEKVRRLREIQTMSAGWDGDSTTLIREDRDSR